MMQQGTSDDGSGGAVASHVTTRVALAALGLREQPPTLWTKAERLVPGFLIKHNPSTKHYLLMQAN